MLDKRTRGGLWLAVVLLENVAFVAYLQVYTSGPRGFLLGFPESFVVLVAFVFLVTAVNASFAWYYLGKPDLSEIYTPESGEEPPGSPSGSPGSEVEGS